MPRLRALRAALLPLLLLAATGAPASAQVRLTVDRHPGSEFGDKDFEFLELQNTGTSAISLSGVKLTVGVTFVFPDMTLQPGQYVLLVENRAAFESKYGTGRPVISRTTSHPNASSLRKILPTPATKVRVMRPAPLRRA